MMTLSSKLNLLQKLAIAYPNEPHKKYIIELLAEHAEEPEMTMEFLAWLRTALQ